MVAILFSLFAQLFVPGTCLAKEGPWTGFKLPTEGLAMEIVTYPASSRLPSTFGCAGPYRRDWDGCLRAAGRFPEAAPPRNRRAGYPLTPRDCGSADGAG